MHIAIADGLYKGAEANRFTTKSHAQGALVQDVLFDRLGEDHRRPPRLIAATLRRASILPRTWIGVAARSLLTANITRPVSGRSPTARSASRSTLAYI